MKLQNIGLIGFGSWIESAYLPILNSKNNAIKAISSKTEKTLLKAKEILGNDCFYTNDYKKLLNRVDIDLIILSVPDELHESIMKDIIASKKNCIFEMPLSENINSAKELIIQMDKSEKSFIPNLEVSYLPIIKKLSDFKNDKSLGNLLNIHMEMNAPKWGPTNNLTKSVYSISPWYIDPLNKISGSIPTRVLTIGEKFPKNFSESRANILLDYKTHWANWNFNIESSKKWEVIVTMTFENSEIIADLINSEIYIYKDEKKLQKIKMKNNLWPGMHDFLTYVENTDHFTNKTTKDLMNISYALQESHITNNWKSVEK